MIVTGMPLTVNIQFLRTISPPKSHIKVTRIKEMIPNQRTSCLLTNSPCAHLRKCVENSVENMHTDIRV